MDLFKTRKLREREREESGSNPRKKIRARVEERGVDSAGVEKSGTSLQRQNSARKTIGAFMPNRNTSPF